MESNFFIDIDTAWTFPIIKYTTNVSYVEVRKASGIAFILLELIEHSENRSSSMEATLTGIGVPTDILYIFAEEISNLIGYNILEMNHVRDYSSDSFNLYKLDDFKMTELGKKLFAEGAIPTGSNSSRKIQILYDASKKDIVRDQIRLFNIDSSPIDQSCVSGAILNDRDIENYISENSGRFGFKKGESITGYLHSEPELFSYKAEKAVNIKIDKERLYITADDRSCDSYIKQCYSPEVISNIIQSKKKFHFPDYIGDAPKCDYSSITDIVDVKLPSQINRIPAKKCQIFLCRDVTIKNSTCLLECEDAAELMENCEIKGFACYFQDGDLFCMLPGRFSIPIDGSGSKCDIDLVVVYALAEDIKQRLTALLFTRCLNEPDVFSQCAMVSQLYEISRNSEYISEFSKSVIDRTDDIKDKVAALDKLNVNFNKMDVWGEISYTIAEDMFSQICSNVSLESLAVMELLCKKLNNYLEYDNPDYLKYISRNLVNTYNSDLLFDAFVNLGFEEISVLGIINVFKGYCIAIFDNSEINGHSSIALHCNLLRTALSQLKDLSGIKNASEDSANPDIDRQAFIKEFSSFSHYIKKVDKYKMFATDEFEKINAFYKRFSELNEVIATEMAATNDPRKINKTYIEQMLGKAKYKEAICDLHIRLQYELNKLYHLKNAGTYQLLSDPDIGNYLNNDELDEMQKLRICRNEFQHPTDKQKIHYSSENIIKWCNIIEKIGGLSSEPRSKN